MQNLLKTPLFDSHEALDAKIIDFGGWALPVNYGSQIEEHHAVRKACGLFDVSHMSVWDLEGRQATSFLRKLLTNDVGRLDQTGKALYSCMLNEDGGVIDDLICYALAPEHYRIVSNAGTREKVAAWLELQLQAFDARLSERDQLALIAVQGPKSQDMCRDACGQELAEFITSLARFQGGFCGNDFVGRTGYTGEDGFEFIIEAGRAVDLWSALLEHGATPCGLGARDTLRLEAGMALYGNDLDENHNPYESGLHWTVKMTSERDFIGKSSLQKTLNNQLSPTKKLVGLRLLDKGVLRGHQTVHHDGREIGLVTSGSFSPTLEQSIGLARINANLAVGEQVSVAVRKKFLSAEIVSYPFYRGSAQ